MGFLLGLASNFVANLVFWVVLGSAFWAMSSVIARRFSAFFGLTRVDNVGIYLSNLSAKPEGAAISLHELRAAQSIDKLFGSAPLRLPEVVRGLVDALWLRQKVRCAIEVSPGTASAAALDRNLIIIGSSARNSVRARYVRSRLPTATLTGEGLAPGSPSAMGDARITITRGGKSSEVNLYDANLAIVEKCCDPERKTTVFFCLGERGDSSWAATEYLVRNWKRLAAEFGDSDFVVCLGFPKTDKYLDEYQQPIRLSSAA